MDLSQVEQLLTTKQVAEMFEVETRIVRRAARKGTIPGVVRILGRTGFVPELVKDWEAPEPGTFGARGPSRDDGRQRYVIFLSQEEYTKLAAEHELVDPRERSKARRAARKAKEAAEATQTVDSSDNEDKENPFGDFNL